MMKKMIALLLVLLVIPVCAFAEGSLLGGWKIAESQEITEEQQALFDRAMEGLLGVNYVPVAYLGSQLVSGTNHCFLCRAAVVRPDAQPTLALVYIYEALDGHTEILNIAPLDIAALSVKAE